MNCSLLAAASVLALGAITLPANAAVNLITNGSFENGVTGWTVSGTGTGIGVVAVPTDGVTPGPYGDVVPADPFTFSPDAAGTHAVDFTDDAANEDFSQTIDVVAGQSYAIGFDLWKTRSGSVNTQPYTLTASLGGTTLATVAAGAMSTATWEHFGETFTANTTGPVDFNFNFSVPSGPGYGQDVMADMVYVVAVPEPGTWALMILGVGGIGAVARRRRVAVAAAT